MGYWEQAIDQAGREAGARFWRWILAVRVIRRVAPLLALAVLAAGLILAYRVISPDWMGVADTIAGWLSTAWPWALLGVAAAAVLALAARGAVWLWTEYAWRWQRW